jgi:hypothetical protein
MKRISIRISDELHEQIRQRAFNERKSINGMVEELFLSLEMEDPIKQVEKVITVAKAKVPKFIKEEPLFPKSGLTKKRGEMNSDDYV